MERHLFQHVNLAPERIHFFDGSAERAERECARYDVQLAAAGGLDLLLLGIGPNGHVAFIEPGESLQAGSHRARLSRESRQAVASLFGDDVWKVPLAALTLGMAALLQARRVIVLAFGVNKAAAVTAMVRGPITPCARPRSSSSTATWRSGWTPRPDGAWTARASRGRRRPRA